VFVLVAAALPVVVAGSGAVDGGSVAIGASSFSLWSLFLLFRASHRRGDKGDELAEVCDRERSKERERERDEGEPSSSSLSLGRIEKVREFFLVVDPRP
jgi:hypothetical protein